MEVCVADGPDDAVPLAEACDLIVVEEPPPGQPLPCRRLRDAGIDRPLLLLCADPAGPADHCADAVAARPVRIAALTLQIERMLARPPTEAPRPIGPWRLDRGRRVLEHQSGRAVRLTDKEAAILSRLARAGGEVVSREALLAEIWGYGTDLDTHTLETHVYRLRRKIEDDTEGPGLLLTEAGGYRLATDGAMAHGVR